MRKIEHVYLNGDRRTRSGFLLMPRSTFDVETRIMDTRWLEHAEWLEEYSCYMGDSYWTTIKWIDRS